MQMYEEKAKGKKKELRKFYKQEKDKMFTVGESKLDKCVFNTNTLYTDIILNQKQKMANLFKGTINQKIIHFKSIFCAIKYSMSLN